MFRSALTFKHTRQLLGVLRRSTATDASAVDTASATTAARRVAGLFAAGGLVAFGGMFIGIAWDRARRRRDLALVANLPILPSNPLVYMDLADGDKPLGRLVVHVRADAAPRGAAVFVALASAPLGHGYRSSPLLGLEKGARVFGGDWFGSGSGSYDPLTGAVGALPVETSAADTLLHIGPGAVGFRSFPGTAHDGAALLSSQFYITLRAMPHLDGVGGRGGQLVGYVVEGWPILDVLDRAGRTNGRFNSSYDLRVSSCGILTPAEADALRAKLGLPARA